MTKKGTIANPELQVSILKLKAEGKKPMAISNILQIPKTKVDNYYYSKEKKVKKSGYTPLPVTLNRDIVTIDGWRYFADDSRKKSEPTTTQLTKEELEEKFGDVLREGEKKLSELRKGKKSVLTSFEKHFKNRGA